MNTKKFNQNACQGCHPMPPAPPCHPPCPPPCPIPGPHPIPPPCPHSHGKIFQGCMAYINAYIDVRVRQLYTMLKGIIQKLSKYFGPWDYIILRDTADGQESLHKVYVYNGLLHSEPLDSAEETSTQDETEEQP